MPSPEKTMKAILFHPPGGPENLHLHASIPIPQPTEPDQILVKVAYASIIPSELHWPIYQDSNGTYHPTVPCRDYSGIVVATSATSSEDSAGFENSAIQVGSEVLCFPNERNIISHGLKYPGGLAEYALADLHSAVLKPINLSFKEAASVPLSALTAWQALFTQPSVLLSAGSGKRVLVTGAAGCTGLWAVQFAKRLGLYVIGTASSEWSKRTMRELGADEVVDYTVQAPLSEYVKDVDFALDTVGGGEVIAELAKVVKEGGEVVSIVDWDVKERLEAKGVRGKFFIWGQDVEQMQRIVEGIEKGELRCFVDSVFPLEKAEEAYRKARAGHLNGKVVVEVGGEEISI